MKKFVVSVLVILSALALFAVTVTPVFDVSGEVGFELLLDESALDINSLVDIDLTVEIPFSTTSGNLSIGLKLNPEVTVGEPVDWDPTTADTHTHTAEFSYKDILDFVQYEEEAWLLRYEPKAIKLSDYTVNQFTDAEGALKFGLKKYNLSLELADLKGDEVDKHATGTLAFPEGWIFGAKYDLLFGEDLEGFVATAFKFQDKGNNRFSIEGNLSKSPLPGEEEVDLVFALLNEEQSTPTTVSTATNAYRVYVDYKYPVTVNEIKLTPHANFKAQEGLEKVFAPEVAEDRDDGDDDDISWKNAREIGAGFDVEAKVDPFKVGVEDTFKFIFLDMDNPEFKLNLKPYLEYAVTDFTLGVDVPMDFTFVSPLEYEIVPHLYTVLGINNLEVAGDVYYFLNDAANARAYKFAYTTDVTYTYNILQTGFHLGNEEWDDDDGVTGAYGLTDLHGYFFLKASIEF